MPAKLEQGGSLSVSVCLSRGLLQLLTLKQQQEAAPTESFVGRAGVVICLECSGVHRKMGVHISKVKSVTLDRWTTQWVAVSKLT